MTQFYASEATNPPGGVSPLTVRGTIATILATLEPGTDVTITSIISVKGVRQSYSNIRATIAQVAPPGHQYACRTVQGGAIKIWRMK